MQLKIFAFTFLLFFSVCTFAQSYQTCTDDNMEMSFLAGHIGKMAITYERNGTAIARAEGDDDFEEKKVDPKQSDKFWSVIDDAINKVEPGKYGILASNGNGGMDINITICNKIYVYKVVGKSSEYKYSDELLNILKNRPK